MFAQQMQAKRDAAAAAAEVGVVAVESSAYGKQGLSCDEQVTTTGDVISQVM